MVIRLKVYCEQEHKGKSVKRRIRVRVWTEDKGGMWTEDKGRGIFILCEFSFECSVIVLFLFLLFFSFSD